MVVKLLSLELIDRNKSYFDLVFLFEISSNPGVSSIKLLARFIVVVISRPLLWLPWFLWEGVDFLEIFIMGVAAINRPPRS